MPAFDPVEQLEAFASSHSRVVCSRVPPRHASGIASSGQLLECSSQLGALTLQAALLLLPYQLRGGQQAPLGLPVPLPRLQLLARQLPRNLRTAGTLAKRLRLDKVTRPKLMTPAAAASVASLRT